MKIASGYRILYFSKGLIKGLTRVEALILLMNQEPRIRNETAKEFEGKMSAEGQ